MEFPAAVAHSRREYTSNVMSHTCSDSEVQHARIQQHLQHADIPTIQTEHTASQPLHIRVPSGAQLEMQFPRPASRSILDEEEHSPDQNMDFSIEKEIVRKANEKKLKKTAEQPKSEFHLAPEAANGLHRKSSSQSLLDTCEDNEDEFIKALEEVDHEERVDEEEEQEINGCQNGKDSKQ